MPRFDDKHAEVLVFTFREGLLSAMGHDLELRAGSFSIDVADDRRSIEARFDARAIRVVSAMRGGAHQAGVLSDRDKRSIEASIADEVLDTKRHAEIRFSSTAVTEEGGVVHVTGTLVLHGRSKSITFTARRVGERFVAEVTLHQPDFGIKPFSAMMGALKIKPDVRVRISVPVPAAAN